MKIPVKPPIHILLADDDMDDRFFFSDVVTRLKKPVNLTAVDDGERLMNYLNKHTQNLPQILFLDLNMPRKNGAECLVEIKKDPRLAGLPVVIYSTSLHEAVADELYISGAHYYVRKTNVAELKKMLEFFLSLIETNTFDRPGRDKFILRLGELA